MRFIIELTQLVKIKCPVQRSQTFPLLGSRHRAQERPSVDTGQEKLVGSCAPELPGFALLPECRPVVIRKPSCPTLCPQE